MSTQPPIKAWGPVREYYTLEASMRELTRLFIWLIILVTGLVYAKSPAFAFSSDTPFKILHLFVNG